MIKTKGVQVISVQDWDELVQKTYGRIYSFQQQDGCKDRGICYITVPSDGFDHARDRIPEVINGNEMGVSFKAWLERDPNAPLNPTDKELAACAYYSKREDRTKWCESKSHINMFYERSFYPHVDTIINDLHTKGLLPAGEYAIDIDW